MKKLGLISLFLLTACGGGGGGSGGGLVQQTPTYTEYVDFVNNGGTVPNVQGQILRSKGINPNTGYANNTEFESFSSITLQYSVPDANGNQSISMSGRVNWDGDPFSGSDTFTGTFDGSEYYDLFLDEHLASVHTVEGDTDVYTIGFVDFGEPRTVEKTEYVTQLMQFRTPWEGLGDFDYDFLAFVMGDQTWASDMPSSGSATYNGFAQMLMSFKVHELEGGLLFYNNGTSTFTADFATRNITGRLEFDYDAAPWDAANGIWADPDDPWFWFELANGTISGTSFSGTTDYDSSTGEEVTNGDYTISFTGNFYGPDATELGGTFTYSELNFETNGYTASFNAIGTFTGCQGC